MAEAKNRLTVVEKVYHQVMGEGATDMVDNRFYRELKTEEQVYQRKLKATEEWQKLDCGWITECGMLAIKNEEGLFHNTLPTPEERAEVATHVLELGIGAQEASWQVLPQESMRGCPMSLQSIYVRCRHGTAKFTLTLFPE